MAHLVTIILAAPYVALTIGYTVQTIYPRRRQP